MKKLNPLFALLIVLTACMPAAENPTATASPALSATLVATEAASPTASLTPTDVKRTATTEPTKAPEQLGGDKIGVAFWYGDGNTILHTPPPEIASQLTPTSPEKWQELMNLTDSTGKPLPWGKSIFFVEQTNGFGDNISPVLPFLVRDIVQYGVHKGENNAPMYFAILESPAKGGSNFYIYQLVPQGLNVNSKYTYIEYSSSGVPTEWIGKKVPIGTIVPLAVDRLSDTGLLRLLQKNVGRVVLLEFPDMNGPVGSLPGYENMVTWLAGAALIPPGYEASRGVPNILLPKLP